MSSSIHDCGSGWEQPAHDADGRVAGEGIGGEMLQVMINSRHQEALQRARAAVESARQGLKEDFTLELVAMELRIGANAVGEIVGSGQARP